MVIGRGDINVPGFDRLAVLGMVRGQRAGAGQDARQYARRRGGEVNDDEHCGRKASGQATRQLGDRFHAAGGGADDDDMMTGHPTL